MRGLLSAATLALLALSGSPREARADDLFYMMIFGSQSDPKQLRYTHSFATFIRATGQGTDPAGYALSAHTISWLPRDLDVRVRSIKPEPGINLDLDSTIRLVQRDGESVTMWGPYLITREMYNKSIEVYNELNSGRIKYRAIDGPFNPRASNCIHAVGDVDPMFGRRRYVLDRVGKPASAYITKQFLKRTGIDQTTIDNGWLIPRLGLTQYPIEYVGNQGPPRVGHYDLESFLSRLRMLDPGQNR